MLHESPSLHIDDSKESAIEYDSELSVVIRRGGTIEMTMDFYGALNFCHQDLV
jgi:hypothetical protein